MHKNFKKISFWSLSSLIQSDECAVQDITHFYKHCIMRCTVEIKLMFIMGKTVTLSL